MYNVLICDDDADIVKTLAMYLSAEGYHIFTANNGQEAMKIVARETVHLILMDIMMPQMDGITATAKLREFSKAPVIMLTAKSEDSDIILGLNMGADDYITKPYSPAQVMARVRSHLRRYAQLGGLSQPTGTLSGGGISLDDDQKIVTLDGEPISLTPREYAILKFLLEHPGTVFSSKELYAAVWGQSPMGAEGSVAVHIRHLREKLELDPGNPRYLKVVWGQGYKLETGRTL